MKKHFKLWTTDQVTSDVYKGLRARVSKITQNVAQLPGGLPIIFNSFQIFWHLSIWRRLYYKNQANKDLETSTEVVMITRKEDLRPMRLVVSNVDYYYSRYYRTMYRDFGEEDRISYSAIPFTKDWWTPKTKRKVK